MFRVLKFKIRVILRMPFYIVVRHLYEKKHRKIAESMGLTFEEYKKRMIVHWDGTPLKDYEYRRLEAEHRKYQLEELKQKYGYKDF